MDRLKSFLKGYKSILVAVIVMALPAIGEMSLNTLLGVADTVMISFLIGSDALAAAGFANNIIFILIFVFSSFNTGATAMIARAFGEKDYDKLNKIAGQTVSVNFIIGVIITILALLFAEEIFKIFEMSAEVFSLTLQYFYIIAFGLLFLFLAFSFGAILRGAGDTFTPMVITGVTNVLNIIGNYVLIIGVGPFPEMGIAGAAWATTISRLIAVVIYIYFLFMKILFKINFKIKLI